MLSSKLDWQVKTQEFWLLVSPALLSSVISMAWNKIHPVNPDPVSWKTPATVPRAQTSPLVFPHHESWECSNSERIRFAPGLCRMKSPTEKEVFFISSQPGKCFPQHCKYLISGTLSWAAAMVWVRVLGKQSVPVLCNNQLEQLPLLEPSLLESPKWWNFPLKCAHPNLHIHPEHILNSQTPAGFISWQFFHNLLTFYSKTFCLLEIQVMGRQWCPFSMLVTQNDKLSSAQGCPLSQQCFVWSCFKRRLFM